jgi:hypothetical protein
VPLVGEVGQSGLAVAARTLGKSFGFASLALSVNEGG